MARARGLAAAVLVALAWRLAARRVERLASDLGPRAGGPKTVVLVGHTGAGRSTLANFLAGRGELFRTSTLPNFLTASVTVKPQVELAGFFGDEALGTVRLVDTPGLLDTKGENASVSQWATTVDTLTADIHEAHALVLVAQPTAWGMLWKTVRQLRNSFGKDFWQALHIVITRRTTWSYTAKEEEEEEEMANFVRQVMVDAEQSAAGSESIDAATRRTIEDLPVYILDMENYLLYADARHEEFRYLDLDGEGPAGGPVEGTLGNLTFAQLVLLDQRLQETCIKNGFASFWAWKRALGKGGFATINHTLQQEGEGLYEWGRYFSQLNICALEAFRRRVQRTNTTMLLSPSKQLF